MLLAHADVAGVDAVLGQEPRAPVYVDGKLSVTLKGERIAEDFAQLLDDYVAKRYASR